VNQNKEFIGFDNDCEIESNICSDEATGIQESQRYEFLNNCYQSNHGFCPNVDC